MKKNMGSIDRTIRVIVAIILIAWVAAGAISGTTGIILSILAVVLLFTSLVRYCPLYSPFGINTIRKKLHTKTN